MILKLKTVLFGCLGWVNGQHVSTSKSKVTLFIQKRKLRCSRYKSKSIKNKKVQVKFKIKAKYNKMSVRNVKKKKKNEALYKSERSHWASYVENQEVQLQIL